MKLGSPHRPDLSKIINQDEINEKVIFSLNENSQEIYNALRKNISFLDNMDGTLLLDFSVRHGNSFQIPHKLGRQASHLLIFGGKHLAQGFITLPGKRSSIAYIYLPNSVVIDSSGVDVYVTNPIGFKIKDEIMVGTQKLEIIAISGNKLTLSSIFTGTNLRTQIYVLNSFLDLFIF